MNKVILIGRLTKDPEVKATSNQTPLCNFTVAVDRKYKDANGNKQADFINCLAWRQQATFIGQYFHKGSKICITGNIQTRSYEDQNNQKVYVTEVVVDEVEFVESASNKPAEQTTPAAAPVAPAIPVQPVPTIPVPEDFGQVPEDDMDLPFEV